MIKVTPIQVGLDGSIVIVIAEVRSEGVTDRKGGEELGWDFSNAVGVEIKIL